MPKSCFIFALLFIAFAGVGCGPQMAEPKNAASMPDCPSCDSDIEKLRSEAVDPADENADQPVQDDARGDEPLRVNEQVKLVGRIFDELLSDTDKADAVVKLVGNPRFSCTAKMIILKEMKALGSSSRRRILEAFYERGGCIPSGK